MANLPMLHNAVLGKNGEVILWCRLAAEQVRICRGLVLENSIPFTHQHYDFP